MFSAVFGSEIIIIVLTWAITATLSSVPFTYHGTFHHSIGPGQKKDLPLLTSAPEEWNPRPSAKTLSDILSRVSTDGMLFCRCRLRIRRPSILTITSPGLNNAYASLILHVFRACI